jgi:hypothetical protein
MSLKSNRWSDQMIHRKDEFRVVFRAHLYASPPPSSLLGILMTLKHFIVALLHWCQISDSPFSSWHDRQISISDATTREHHEVLGIYFGSLVPCIALRCPSSQSCALHHYSESHHFSSSVGPNFLISKVECSIVDSTVSIIRFQNVSPAVRA